MGFATFKVKEFTDQINKLGYNIGIQIAILCPCYDLETGQPDPNCSFCDNGYYYEPSYESKAIFSGIKQGKVFDESGAWISGMSYISTKPNIHLAYHDRIVNTDSAMVHTEHLQRIATETTKYDIIESYIDERKTIKLPVTIISIVAGAIKHWRHNSDFRINKGKLTWFPGKGPAIDDRYSVRYYCNPVWIVLEAVHAVRDTITEKGVARLPLQAVARLEVMIEE